MKHRSLCAALAAALVMASAFAADLVLRPGRWQQTSTTEFGPNRPQGMPASSNSVDIKCLAKPAALDASSVMPLVAEGCKVSNYKAVGSTIRFTASCEEGTMDIEFTLHAADSYSGTASMRGSAPGMQFTTRFSGKRTADACSAKELEEWNSRD